MLQEIVNAHKAAVSSINFQAVEKAAEEILLAIKRGNKILICGCGGSAADAQHFAAELVGRFDKTCTPLPGIALTTDSSVLTALSNDFSFDEVFSRQIMAFGDAGDVLVAISTSGKSPSIIRAIEKANDLEIRTIILTGPRYIPRADIALIVDFPEVARIQECHILILHMICALLELER